MPLLSIIVPTYNESENLPILIWLLVNELEKGCAPQRCPAGVCMNMC